MGREPMGVKDFLEYTRAEKRRAAWITFAAGALAGLCSDTGAPGVNVERIPEVSGNHADRLLAELDKLDKQDFSGSG